MLLKKPFYFVRHGETDYNRNYLCAGSQIDAPLNKTGKNQAKLLREKIDSLPVNKVICSPLKRTFQTATLATSHPLIIEHDMRECDLGDFEQVIASFNQKRESRRFIKAFFKRSCGLSAEF